jgi:type IV pilus assembly protein PilQ
MNTLLAIHAARGTPVTHRHGLHWATLLALLPPILLAPWAGAEAATVLQNVEFAALPDNRVQIDLVLSGAPKPPDHFSTDSPARIALDFPGVSSGLQNKTVPVGVGVVDSVVAVEAGDRTRVVVNLNESVPYEVTTRGDRVTVSVNAQQVAAQPVQPEPQAAPAPAARGQRGGQARAAKPAPRPSVSRGPALRDLDFRRGDSGEGRVVVKLPDSTTRVAVREQGKHVLVDVFDTALPQRLFRRLDVTDFATAVASVETKPKGRDVEIDILAGSDYDYLAYQTDDLFTLEFRKLSKAEKEDQRKKDVVYSGDRLSLNFQDIEVRAVLQLLADFTGLNLVASDTVDGNITLRLKNVPWDQALDIILKTKGLTKREAGNVIMVAPTPEVAAQDKLAMESEQQIEELAPLRSEFVQVNYAKAADLAALLKSEDNKLLSERGNVTFDKRTNSLLVKDTSANLEDVRKVVGRLDVPVRQVMIESRIVIANNDFARELGVRFGLSFATGSLSGNQLLVGGTQPGGLENTATYNAGAFGQSIETGTPYNPIIVNPLETAAQGLMVDLPVTAATGPSGVVNFLIGKVGSYLLNLELQAMQSEGRGEIVSSPRVVTSDQRKATIKVGKEIPYQESSQNSTTNTVAFKEAVLKLDVTPSITPDDRIVMDLKVNKDDPDFSNSVNGVPPINTRAIETTVLVDNGETVVLGGVYERTKIYTKEQVPWLGDIPILGNLFKMKTNSDKNSELLIFVTPKILKSEMVTNDRMYQKTMSNELYQKTMSKE